MDRLQLDTRTPMVDSLNILKHEFYYVCKHRLNLGSIAFKKFKEIWQNNKNIYPATKIRLYEAIVVPIILYNSCTWAAPKNTMEEVDRYHRKQLRQILNIKWSDKMTNTRLYEKANVKPLPYRILKARWKMTWISIFLFCLFSKNLHRY